MALSPQPALLVGLGMVSPGLAESAASEGGNPLIPHWNPRYLGSASSMRPSVLKAPDPRVAEPWAFEGNGGYGVKTWLSEAHVIEINPLWLDFAMFESMALSMTEDPPGPGQSEPQEWRSAFTVGMATDWHFTRRLALHAGYRFYSNPIPKDTSSGAFPDADQHIVACGMSFTEGPHSVSLVYGLDMLDPSRDSGVSSARYGDDMDSVAHLVTLNYGFSF